MKRVMFKVQTMLIKYCKAFCIYFAILIVMCGILVESGSTQTWMPDANLRAAVLADLISDGVLQTGDTIFTQANLADSRFTELDANVLDISDLTGLEYATNLTQIELDSNQIHYISALSSLSKLAVLLIHDNPIYDTQENINALKSLTALTFIAMGAGTGSFIASLNRLPLITAARGGDDSGLRALLVPAPPPAPADESSAPVDEPVEAPRRRIIQDCPVGWVRSDGFAGRNRRVLLYEVKLEMDMSNPVSIYKPVWVAIYVHPDEGLENLDSWKLQVALPYNRHREYLLTAENSVVVNAGFVEGGFAFIENPEENPFPMTGIGFTGSPAPGFDYRLYDETGKRVDFGISCYKRFDIFQVLKEMEDPRVLRKVLLESFDWNQHYLRSEWTVPVPVNAPGSPSLPRVNLVGKWANLKKQ